MSWYLSLHTELRTTTAVRQELRSRLDHVSKPVDSFYR